jgi:hypothetical protein
MAVHHVLTQRDQLRLDLTSQHAARAVLLTDALQLGVVGLQKLQPLPRDVDVQVGAIGAVLFQRYTPTCATDTPRNYVIFARFPYVT